VATRPGRDTKADKYRDSPDSDTRFRTKPNLDPQRHIAVKTHVGWAPSCGCPDHDPVPCVVLDPFAGSGTTLAVAVEEGRQAIGIELNPDYHALIRRRLAGVTPGLFV
jgi:hypothetical protein